MAAYCTYWKCTSGIPVLFQHDTIPWQHEAPTGMCALQHVPPYVCLASHNRHLGSLMMQDIMICLEHILLCGNTVHRSVHEVWLDKCSHLTALNLDGHPSLRLISARGCRLLATVDVRCKRVTMLLVGQVGYWLGGYRWECASQPTQKSGRLCLSLTTTMSWCLGLSDVGPGTQQQSLSELPLTSCSACRGSAL
jgi:hypothetical protein